jgi:hypothetical protein
LDSVKYGGQNFINNNNINWINVCDTKSWDGKTANDYFIYATPAMFLVDKNRKIIANPTTMEELKLIFN